LTHYKTGARRSKARMLQQIRWKKKIADSGVYIPDLFIFSNMYCSKLILIYVFLEIVQVINDTLDIAGSV
jgi:hypothetical protein